MNVLLLYLFGSLVLGFGSAMGPVRARHYRILLAAAVLLATTYLSLRFI
jgi:hypothetical protein